MGNVHRLMMDKCEMYIPNEKLVDFADQLKSIFDVKIEVTLEKLLEQDSYWFSIPFVGYSTLFDFHLIRQNNGLMVDNIQIASKWGYDDEIKIVKEMFKEFKATIWAWLTDESRENFDFFKIENGVETTYDYNNRPKDWLESPPKEAFKPEETGLNFNEIWKHIKENNVSFRPDKCNIPISTKQIQSMIQPAIDEAYSRDEMKYNEYPSIKVNGDIVKYITGESSKYDKILSWHGSASIRLNINEQLGNTPSLVDFEMYARRKESSSDAEFILSISILIIDYCLKKSGTLWGYYLSDRDKKFHFIKVENQKLYRFPFTGRPVGW